MKHASASLLAETQAAQHLQPLDTTPIGRQFWLDSSALDANFGWILAHDGGQETGKIQGWRVAADAGGRAKTRCSTEHLTLTTVLTTAPPHVGGLPYTERYAEPEQFWLGVRWWTLRDGRFGVRLSPISTQRLLA